MQAHAIFLLIALAVMSCSGEQHEDPKGAHSLAKRKINCPPMAICQPATQPPLLRSKKSPDQAADDSAAIDAHLVGNPIFQSLSGTRQKRGSKPVTITACNRKTGKCTKI